MDPAVRDRVFQMAMRAAGHEQGHHYWTRDPEGLARWAKSAHPFDTLVAQLVEHVHIPAETAKRWANVWYHDVFGFYPGSDAARIAHGKPPRGHRVGPG